MSLLKSLFKSGEPDRSFEECVLAYGRESIFSMGRHSMSVVLYPNDLPWVNWAIYAKEFNEQFPYKYSGVKMPRKYYDKTLTAPEMFKLASDQGDSDSAFLLAVLHEHNALHDKSDPNLAKAYHDLAMERGSIYERAYRIICEKYGANNNVPVDNRIIWARIMNYNDDEDVNGLFKNEKAAITNWHKKNMSDVALFLLAKYTRNSEFAKAYLGVQFTDMGRSDAGWLPNAFRHMNCVALEYQGNRPLLLNVGQYMLNQVISSARQGNEEAIYSINAFQIQ